MTDWHGWRIRNQNIAYHVGEYPGRKKITLIRKDGIATIPVAAFTSEESAKTFQDWLDEMLDVVRRSQ